MRLRLFGPMQAETHAGRNVLPRQRKSRALLAVLALAAPRAVPRSQLTDLLWSRRDPEQARGSLRNCVHDLQNGLAPAGSHILLTGRTSLALAPGAVTSDAADLVTAATQHPEALDAFERGAFLQDLVGLDPAFDAWIAAEDARLRAAGAAVAASLLDVCLDEKRPWPVVRAMAERVLAFDRTQEGAWRALIRGHAAEGEQAAAIDAYRRCRTALAELAQVPPSAETEALAISLRARAPAQPTDPIPAQPMPPRQQPARRAQLRLGIMPFRTAQAAAPEPLSVGLAEEVTTAMSRFRGVALIASASLAALRDADLTERERGLSSLALDFLIDGTIQRAGGRVRVNSQLLDMEGDGTLGRPLVWAQRFEGGENELLLLQDRVAAEMVARVDPEMMLRAGARARSLVAADLSAYELMLRAIPAIYALRREPFEEAGALLRQAAAADPDHAAPLAWLAYWLAFRVGQGWSEDTQADMAEAARAADQAVRLDPADARALTIAGHVRAFLMQDLPDAQVLHDRAIALNPNMPIAWALSGLAQSYDGQHAEALARCERAYRLSPFDPHRAFYDTCTMLPLVMTGEYERAAALARQTIAVLPTLTSAYKGLLAALGHLGDAEGSARVLERLLALEPAFTIEEALARSPLRRTQDRAHYAEGLRRGGLPEAP